MDRRITITAGGVSVEAELNDSPCAAAIFDDLPIERAANTWGDEIYFDIGVSCDLADDARAEMAVGELAYWPPGKAFCVFFGPTPASGPDGQPRAASEVNPIGKVIGDPSVLRNVRDGQTVTLAKAV